MTREDLEEFYEERCAILQFDGGWPKEKAEAARQSGDGKPLAGGGEG